MVPFGLGHQEAVFLLITLPSSIHEVNFSHTQSLFDLSLSYSLYSSSYLKQITALSYTAFINSASSVCLTVIAEIEYIQLQQKQI